MQHMKAERRWSMFMTQCPVPARHPLRGIAMRPATNLRAAPMQWHAPSSIRSVMSPITQPSDYNLSALAEAGAKAADDVDAVSVEPVSKKRTRKQSTSKASSKERTKANQAKPSTRKTTKKSTKASDAAAKPVRQMTAQTAGKGKAKRTSSKSKPARASQSRKPAADVEIPLQADQVQAFRADGNDVFTNPTGSTSAILNELATQADIVAVLDKMNEIQAQMTQWQDNVQRLNSTIEKWMKHEWPVTSRQEETETSVHHHTSAADNHSVNNPMAESTIQVVAEVLQDNSADVVEGSEETKLAQMVVAEVLQDDAADDLAVQYMEIQALRQAVEEEREGRRVAEQVAAQLMHALKAAKVLHGKKGANLQRVLHEPIITKCKQWVTSAQRSVKAKRQ